MRITHKFSAQVIKSHLGKRVESMETAWRHVSTGKAVERPSDDPAAISRILSYRSLQSEVEQRRFQAEQGLSVLTTADSAFDMAGKVMEKAQGLAIASGSGSATPEDRKIMGTQVEQMLTELVDIADTKYDDRPLFAGGAANFSASDLAGLELGRDSVFGPAIASLEQLKTELMNGTNASDDSIGDLKNSVDNMLSYRTQVGARMNRLEGLESRLLVMEQDLMQRRSTDEEVDMARAMVDLKEEETAYQSALAATSRIMRVSLVDFL